MVKVQFFRDNHGYQAMDLDGHADYNPGNDVVCAGISSLAYALAGTLRNIDDVSFVRFDIRDGVHVEIEPFTDEIQRTIADTVFKTCIIGLKQIEIKYPDHIVISEVTL